MEGITRWPGPRIENVLRAHPHVSIAPPVDGIWRATVNLDCGHGEVHGGTEKELLAKLADALAALGG